MEDAPDELVVEFEEVDGRRRIKRLPDGSHPLDLFVDMIKEANREYKRDHNGYDGYDVATEPARGDEEGTDYDIIVVYHTPYGKQREVVSRTVIVDAETGKPAARKSGTAKLQKCDSPRHVELTFSAELAREKAAKRGLHLRAGDMRAVKVIKEKLEGA